LPSWINSRKIAFLSQEKEMLNDGCLVQATITAAPRNLLFFLLGTTKILPSLIRNGLFLVNSFLYRVKIGGH
jgi:hypothetical protein